MNGTNIVLLLSKWSFSLIIIMVCLAKNGISQPITDDDFVLVEGGCFQMGDVFGDGVDLEQPVHEVCLSDYFISKYEVTQQLWQQVMGMNPSLNQDNKRFPVDVVNFWHIEEFLEKLNAMTGKKYRLPTEAEWEFACRARGKKVKYGTQNGTLQQDLANYTPEGNEESTIMEVGSFPPNELGIYDMSGNVSEWVMDWYDRNHYKQSPINDPVVLETRMPTLKVRRGGFWGDKGWILRCSFRNYRRPGHRLIGLGFRLARDATDETVISTK